VRAYLRHAIARAGLDKKVTPHKLRYTYATRLLEFGAEMVDIQVLLGHVNLANTQIYTHVSEGRMAGVVYFARDEMKLLRISGKSWTAITSSTSIGRLSTAQARV
jgi:site-specific recombinase XerC